MLKIEEHIGSYIEFVAYIISLDAKDACKKILDKMGLQGSQVN